MTHIVEPKWWCPWCWAHTVLRGADVVLGWCCWQWDRFIDWLDMRTEGGCDCPACSDGDGEERR